MMAISMSLSLVDGPLLGATPAKAQALVAACEKYLTKHPGEVFFAEVDAESDALAERLRRECLAMPDPAPSEMFAHAYHEPHPLVAEEQAWFEGYQASFEPAVAAAPGGGAA